MRAQEDEELYFKHYFVPFTAKKAVAFLVIIGFIIFFFGLFNNFVGDDNTQIVDNPSIQSLSNVPSFFFSNRLDIGGKTRLGGLYYKPMLDTTYTIIYSISGATPFLFHFVQLLLFIANSILLFFILKQFFNLRLSFILSLIFLVHPINAESAFYIADVQEVLFFFFGASSFLILLKRESPKAIIFASALLLLSLFSKETGILFFAISLIYIFLYKRKIFLPFLGTSIVSFLIYIILRIHATGLTPKTVINAPIERLDLAHRLINAPSIFLFYVKTFIFPLNIAGSWQWAYTNITFYNFYLPLLIDVLILGGIFASVYYLYKKFPKKHLRLFTFFAVWFIIGVMFHLQIYPLDQTAADRWFYFPVVGVLGMIGVAVSTLKLKQNSKWVVIISVVLVSLLSLRTFVRSFDYRNDFTLATHDANVSKDSYNAEYIISRVYYSQNKLQLAKEHALKSIALFPYITNYTNLGAIESKLGDYAAAKKAYLSALRYGQDSLPYENLASLALVYGNRDENINFIKNVSLRKFPKDGPIWFDLALLDYMQGNNKSANQDLQKARLYYNSPTVNFIETIFSSNKKIEIEAQNGNVQFVIK